MHIVDQNIFLSIKKKKKKKKQKKTPNRDHFNSKDVFGKNKNAAKRVGQDWRRGGKE